MLNRVRVEEYVLRIEAQRFELFVELFGRDELAIFGERVDDLLFARIVVALEFHAEITDLAKRFSGRENNRLEGLAKRAREAVGLASLLYFEAPPSVAMPARAGP
ncbi:MAG: hypothetical protein H0W86_10785 [Armatimonadetes bacterium]|nr:hypothetical protein [Armatimonadota bacterium]